MSVPMPQTSNSENLKHEPSASVMAYCQKTTRLLNCARSMKLCSRDVDSTLVLVHSPFRTIPGTDNDSCSIAHKERLTSLLATFSLQSVAVSADGNCLFTAVCHQLDVSVNLMGNDFKEHVQSLNLQSNMHFDSFLLRQVVLDEMETNAGQYIPYLPNMNAKKYKSLLKQYRNSGEFAGNFGDLLIVAVGHTLRVVILLLSSNKDLPFQSITPNCEILSSRSLYLVFNCAGAGHYVSTEPIFMAENIISSDESSGNNCRCGINSKNASSSIKEKSYCKNDRCTCVKEQRKCVN
jgi:hypothetical protein